MRTFALINNDGLRYELTEKKVSFLHSVDGLGYQREIEFQRIGEHFSLVDDHLSQGVISGSVKFWQPGAYEQYFKFSQFCQNKPLKLAYSPNNGITFYRDGYVSKITKSESNSNVLSASIEFKAITPWYKVVSAYNSGEITGGKVYNYVYDYQYSEGVLQTVIINSDSYENSPAKITIYGPLVNPSWSHYLNNKLVATGKVNGTIEKNNKLVIDTTTIPYTIRQYDMSDNLISDMYQLSDFSTYRFMMLGYGENIISVTQEGTGVIKLSVEAKIEYATV